MSPTAREELNRIEDSETKVEPRVKRTFQEAVEHAKKEKFVWFIYKQKQYFLAELDNTPIP